jgi:hypothetical protein
MMHSASTNSHLTRLQSSPMTLCIAFFTLFWTNARARVFPLSIYLEEWQFFCNGYALNGFLPQGTRQHMGDNYMCIAVASIYTATVKVHIGPEEAAMRCTPLWMEVGFQIAPLIWSNIVHLNGSIIDPRGRWPCLLRLLALPVRVWRSLRADPRRGWGQLWRSGRGVLGGPAGDFTRG